MRPSIFALPAGNQYVALEKSYLLSSNVEDASRQRRLSPSPCAHLPIFVRSKKDTRYRKDNQGISIKSSFLTSLRS